MRQRDPRPGLWATEEAATTLSFEQGNMLSTRLATHSKGSRAAQRSHFPPHSPTGSVLCLSHRACPELETPLALAQGGIQAAGGGAAPACALPRKQNMLAPSSPDLGLSPQPCPGCHSQHSGCHRACRALATSAQPKCSNSLNPNSLNLKS